MQGGQNRIREIVVPDSSKPHLETLYRQLYRIRRVEEEVARVYPTDCIKSPVHLSIGQEAASVGVCEALQPDDRVFGTYRGHALYMAKRGDLKKMVAELYGKDTGCTRGKGGSMHLIEPSAGLMGTSAVVGTTIPHAVGFAQALRMQKSRAVVAVFFGDGAMEEGVFHESLSFAVLKKLPVLFVCENNFYAIHAPLSHRQTPIGMCERVAVHGVPAVCVDDGDVERIYQEARLAITRMRESGEGPWFLECHAYRWREHVGPNEDFHAGYRTRDEMQPWLDSDPVVRIGARLDDAVRKRIGAEVEAEVAEAFAFAEASPFPYPDELYTDVYKEA